MGGRRPGLPERDGRVECQHCGRWFKSLGPHLRFAGITAAEYRAEHRLPATTALMASGGRAMLHEAKSLAYAEDPSMLEPMRAAALPVAELAARSAAARAQTDRLPAVRAARARGADKVRQAAAAARTGRALQAAGHASVEDALATVEGLTQREAAKQLGIGRTTLRRWRAKTGHT